MLRLDKITKDYVMKDSEVHALKGISLCFRKNEFVAVLGPSGCGKTTLLNILGGLDHYTSGNLLIEGHSTKDFKDHDWDIYRNHRIGFIFQSYNLIPQENILENVELALTIGGITKEEREEKARLALDKVGLKDLYKKKPNQLSGGQCQRVAIARALVNEPDVLLADEPTGALDSVTSVQIMDLIKSISKEKLVIMVTHNPQLADEYATRTVRLLDGEVVSDSSPYSAEEEGKERDEEKKNEIESKIKNEKAKMSWWTAFKLSAKNLWVKAKRTVMIIIAASIGIVGVSAVLAVSNGVTEYIDGMQDEMLSGNPIQVAEEAYDLSSLVESMSSVQQTETVASNLDKGYVNVDSMVAQLVSQSETMGNAMITNTITQDYIDYIDAMPSSYYSAMEKYYGIDVTNNIYTEDDINGHEDGEYYSLSSLVNLATSIVSQTPYKSYASMISSSVTTFAQGLSSEDYILSQYDVVEGKYATEENEVVIVLNGNDQITDFILTLLGYYSEDDFLNCIYKYSDPTRFDQEAYDKLQQISISDLIGKKFTYYPNDTIYAENTDTASSALRPYYYSYQPDSSWDNGMDMKVVGVLTPKEGRQYCTLSSGFYYTPKFTKKFLADNYSSSVTEFIREYTDANTDKTGYTSYQMTASSGLTIKSGIYYDFSYEYQETAMTDTCYVGNSDSLSNILSLISNNQASSTSATLSLRNVGGKKIPYAINFYPHTFNDKNLVTDYLDKWNSDETLTFADKTINAANRTETDYTDNLSVIISMVDNIINIVTIALVCFTSLSLVVSTVMIGIITYVSVMERIKEIGVIRALGGRKKDVSHLFTAETFIIGFLSGLFGVGITYIFQIVLNAIISSKFAAISAIASLSPLAALVILLISVLLTFISGVLPARSAARKDPVVALRTE